MHPTCRRGFSFRFEVLGGKTLVQRRVFWHPTDKPLSQPASLLEHRRVMLSHSGVIAARRNARSLMRLANPITANPSSSIAQVDGSGTDDVTVGSNGVML